MGSRPSRGQSSGVNPEEDGVEGSASRSCRVQTGGRNPTKLFKGHGEFYFQFSQPVRTPY